MERSMVVDLLRRALLFEVVPESDWSRGVLSGGLTEVLRAGIPDYPESRVYILEARRDLVIVCVTPSDRDPGFLFEIPFYERSECVSGSSLEDEFFSRCS